MFGKKKCRECGSKIEKGYEFCPKCGSKLKKGEGLLDELDERNPMAGFGMGFNNSLFSKLVNKLTKDLEKQFQGMEKIKGKEIKEEKGSKPKIMSGGLTISISSGGKDGAPEIKVKNFGNDVGKIKMMPFPGMPMMPGMMPKQAKEKKSIKQVRLTKEQENKMEKLPKVEPQTMVRRLSNRIIYEIDIPGAKKEDIIIGKFKDSIEIKAFSKDKVFIKIIPVSLPILKHSLINGKLNLELKPEM